MDKEILIKKFSEKTNVLFADFVYEMGKYCAEQYKHYQNEKLATNDNSKQNLALGRALGYYDIYQLLKFLTSGMAAFETHRTRMDELLKEFSLTPTNKCCGEI